MTLSGTVTYVLAGGLGTRVRSVLGDVPKLLAPIKGEPYIEILLRWLRRSHVQHVVLGLGHQAGSIVNYLRENPPAGLKIECVIEPAPLGTAGALRFAREKLRSDPVLVINGDSILDANLSEFLSFHRGAGARASMMCMAVDHAGRFGRVEIEGDFVARFVEKDPAFTQAALVNAGAYLLSSSLMDEISAGNARSLELDVFGKMPAGGIAAFVHRGTFIDFGTPDDLKLANSQNPANH